MAMKRYSIMVVENEGERELCQCDHNPQEIARGALSMKKIIHTGTRTMRVAKFQSVRIVENKDADAKQ